MNLKMVIVTYMLTADQLARQGSSLPFVGLKPAVGISAKVATRVIRSWMSMNQEDIHSLCVDKHNLRSLLKDPLLKKLCN